MERDGSARKIKHNGGDHEMGKAGAGTFFCLPDTIDPREKKE